MPAKLLYSEYMDFYRVFHVSVSTLSRADNMMSEPNLEG